ncbi:hypothetical protein MRB53_039649 [Persea americana]|nr:hypothetical protein MRB53_039649 [Persea americana]
MDDVKENEVEKTYDISDTESEPVKPAKKPAPKKVAAPKPKPVKAEPVKKAPTKKPEPVQSPAAKAYAKKIAKKRALEDEEEDSVVGQLLDSPDGSEDESVVKPKARAGRRAATTAKKMYTVDEDDSEGDNGFSVQSEASDAFSMDDDDD